MLPNEYVTVTRVGKNFRSTSFRFAGFNNCKHTATEILSEFDVECFRKYGELPFVTSQVITDGAIDVYKYFVTFPHPSTARYVVKFWVVNDLPF